MRKFISTIALAVTLATGGTVAAAAPAVAAPAASVQQVIGVKPIVKASWSIGYYYEWDSREGRCYRWDLMQHSYWDWRLSRYYPTRSYWVPMSNCLGRFVTVY